MSNWLGSQIKGYVESQIPSWANLPNNPTSKFGQAVITQIELPEISTNYIYVGEGCFVQPADELYPFVVKSKYEEI
ncbi:MAG: hypothetical protein M0P12_00720 [Paludibacteraceae bacterium]|nr:hypothetical protein [Paludibacteraceae bacterium]